MNITVIGRGRIGGGLARLWRSAGHQVTALGREGGDASEDEVVVVAVPGQAIGDALTRVKGLNGQVTIDATNIYVPRTSAYPSLAHEIKAVIGGPTAKSFSTNFAALYDDIAGQRVKPSNLYASDPGARQMTERLIADAGYDPVFAGDLDRAARLLEDGSALTRAISGQIGPYFYRYGNPGEF
ncbi:dinucleotide-binding protein [Sphaerisporangium album]|uniref:Dinucleotide-binding protein n=1 Tax=Sphaerisporangium album TaxID=509200 RepID=A0A367ETJ7_9ACTN|nr:dinucleotide-binding protein [Sphaerisporangium album]RCG21012.1 dinucleotide-binding protein [Sphaerisporangium album]